jgi:hypothetical protein
MAGVREQEREERAASVATEPLDVDAFVAVTERHPSWRQHRAHPALGLVAAEKADDPPPGGHAVRDLGVKWLTLPLAEQRARERDMTTALLRVAVRRGDARFSLMPWASGATRAALRTLPEVRWDVGGACWGPLTDDVVAVLARRPCADLLVESGGEPFLAEASNDEPRNNLFAWLDPWSAGELRAELEEAWWPAAQARAEAAGGGVPVPRDGGRVSRDTRAAILYAWEKRGWQVARVAALLLLSHVLGDTFLNAAAVFVVLLVVATIVDSRLTRWHRRS